MIKAPKIRIKHQDGVGNIKVYINDERVTGIRTINFFVDPQGLPLVQMEFLATDIDIETTIVPELPKILKPFYVPRLGEQGMKNPENKVEIIHVDGKTL